MSERPTIHIPIRGFSGAMRRLDPSLDGASRHLLARALAENTINEARAVARTVVVTSDTEVIDLAHHLGVEHLDDPGSLDAAAHAATAHTDDWVVLHADLPLLRASDLAALIDHHNRCPAIAPSYDGGTTAIAGSGTFPFSYGPGSAARHLRAASSVVHRSAFQLDIDHAGDLIAAMGHPRGAWLRHLLDPPVSGS